ncbi:MAG: GxxExxY protein [Bacteroidetes bacterium]|jgi:GxxExxY protein|nr:MAG: GxxExxY protein [Bacteroidota bacterium]|tara:strand:+ start:121 stop:504 length:384 start_codon:yes stop_codon:yes gene_type:complete
MPLTENEISRLILDCSFRIHTQLGPGIFESVYEEVLYYELQEEGLEIKRQFPIPVQWNNKTMEMGFKADLIVEDKVIIELKSIESLQAVHKKQLLTYLRLSGIKLGLLINFNENLLKNGIKRIVNGL